jgi:hypothetical protein
MREEARKQRHYKKEHTRHYYRTTRLYKFQLNNLLRQLMLDSPRRQRRSQLIF